MEDRIFGRRYRATEKIGAGGMAEVFKAVDEVLGRTVAVKVMHPRYAADQSYAARFRQEAQAAANLQSPYIVNIYDWGQEGDTYYIVMEYVRGTDLKSIIQSKGALESRRVAEIGAQVCSALSVAHGYDVIHRDIKPHNIMVTPDGSAKVMDFGIARAGNSTMTQTGSVLGTAHYVSPEQAQGRTLTDASDLYSLGVVLFEASTGRLPFDADSPVAVALKQVNEAPPLPRQINPNIDPGLEAIIVTAMAKDPHARYDTSDEMRRDLLRVVQGRDVATTPAVAIGAAPRMEDQHTSVMPQVSNDPYRNDSRAQNRGGQSRKRPVWPWLVVAALLVAAGLGIAGAMGLLGSQGVPVPDLVGMTADEAANKIAAEGFILGEVTEVNDKDIPAGQVFDQSPVASATADKGSAINLTVSKGPVQVEVPDIVDMTEDEAVAALRDAGLVPQGLPDQPSEEVEAGKVISQEPSGGDTLDEGSIVQYVVSRGVETVTVPDVVGEKRKTAEKTLKNAGLKSKVTEQFSEDIASGLVISQSPTKGFVGAKGSTVSLIVSKGPERYEVPDVFGKTEAQARAAIEKAKLVVDAAYFLSEDTGLVTEQSVPAGTMVKAGTVVGILIDSAAP